MPYYMGIDPGSKGAIAILPEKGTRLIILPFAKKETHEIVEILAGLAKDIKMCCLEEVHAMPAYRKNPDGTMQIMQGSVSTFKFGYAFGYAYGITAALNIDIHYVSPSKWQRTLGCLTKGDKNITKRLALELYPESRATHETADAILLAHYCRIMFSMRLDYDERRNNIAIKPELDEL